MTVAAADPAATVSRFDTMIQQIRSYIEEFAAGYDPANGRPVDPSSTL